MRSALAGNYQGNYYEKIYMCNENITLNKIKYLKQIYYNNNI